jgi:RNA polymerase sigma factor (sigma-70 family)
MTDKEHAQSLQAFYLKAKKVYSRQYNRHFYREELLSDVGMVYAQHLANATENYPIAYPMVILKRRIVDRLRKEGTRGRHDKEDTRTTVVEERIDIETSNEVEYRRIEMMAIIKNRLQKLPENYQLIFRLYNEIGYSLREIGLMFDLGEASICNINNDICKYLKTADIKHIRKNGLRLVKKIPENILSVLAA